MNRVKLQRISFGSYIKLLFISGISIGLVMGLLFLIIGLAGGSVSANIGTLQFTGAVAGVLGLILSPVICGIFGAWFGLFAYLPFKLALKLFKGFGVNMQIADGSGQVPEE